MKQTAIEWLINEHFGSIENCTPDFRNKINQAKEMEKQQIKSARHSGRQDLRDNGATYKEDEYAEQYYNETFKSE
jgi:vacuolar-type H+-ATPase subunit H